MESPSPDGPASLERLGRYQLVTEIGQSPLGALSAAYVLSGAEEGRIVAIRRVPIGASNREAQQRISRAGIGAMSIRHARLTAALDVIPGPNSVAIASEYVEAASLRALLRQTAIHAAPLPAPVAVSIAIDVLRALRAARDLWRELAASSNDSLAGYLHGGLLPDSVMIASFGETMLADVGVAGAAARVPVLLEHPDALPYRAPEQLSNVMDERTDVYTVGVLLWEMLANRPLFGNLERFRRIGLREDAADIRRSVRNSAIPRLDKIDRPGTKLQPMLVEIVHEALAREPAQRFPTFDALIDALKTLARDAVASPEQISVAVDRLVRSELEARRVAIELVVSYDRASAPPESARSTARPPQPEAPLRVAGPGLSIKGRADATPRFETPTVRRRKTPPPNTVAAISDESPAATGAAKPVPPAPRAPRPPSALGRITAGAALPTRVPPTAEPVPASGELEVPVSIQPDSLPRAAPEPAPEPPPQAEGAQARSRDSNEPSGVAVSPALAVSPLTADVAPGPGRRRTVVLVLAVAAVVALIALVMVKSLGSDKDVAVQRPPPKRPASAAPASSVPAAPPPVEPAPEVKTTPSAASPAETAEEPEKTERPAERPQEPIRGAPATGKKPYRPRGI